MICCGDCKYFTHDKVGDGTGIGTCSKYEEHKVKHGKKAAHPKGGSLYPNRQRNCTKFSLKDKGL